MLAIWLVVFREVYEAALIIGIVAAATRGVPRRWQWMGAGLLLGGLGAGLVALGADQLSQAFGGMGQEWFNAGILLLATSMIAWHVLWMSRHGRKLATSASQLGSDVTRGMRSMMALMLVVAMTVLREGSEVVLFAYGMLAGGLSRADLLVGAILGICSGTAIGMAMYAGLLKIPMRHFFKATNAMLILVAAGLATSAVGFLSQANALPTLIDPLWDSSWVVGDQSWLGRALHALVGYTSHPSAMQVLAYVAIVMALALYPSLSRPSVRKEAT